LNKSVAGHGPGWRRSYLFVFEDFSGYIGKFLPQNIASQVIMFYKTEQGVGSSPNRNSCCIISYCSALTGLTELV